VTKSAFSVWRSARSPKIEPQPQRSKVTFRYDAHYKVPADAKSGHLVPVTGDLASHSADSGLHLGAGPGQWGGDSRSALPFRWSTTISANNCRSSPETAATHAARWGQYVGGIRQPCRGEPTRAGTNFRDTIIKLSQAFSGYSAITAAICSATLKNLSILVSALAR